MSLDLLIDYHNPARESFWHPFSVQSVLRECWWPLAEKLELAMLQRLECLWINEVWEAKQFVSELRIVQQHLQQSGPSDVPTRYVAYMLERIDTLLPFIEHAISE